MKFVIAIFCFFWSAAVFAAVGSIDSFDGEVSILSKGVTRVANKRTSLEEGDVIRSGKGAWALVQMIDGALLTVRPQTEFRIEMYRYALEADPATMRSVISLTQGALRIVTGLIGKHNRAGYALKTPSATIGIRGTDHDTAHVGRDAASGGVSPGTYDQVHSGGTVLRSSRGDVQVNPGQTAHADLAGLAQPRLLDREPRFYQSYREIDRRVAPRREELQRKSVRQRGVSVVGDKLVDAQNRGGNEGDLREPPSGRGSGSAIESTGSHGPGSGGSRDSDAGASSIVVADAEMRSSGGSSSSSDSNSRPGNNSDSGSNGGDGSKGGSSGSSSGGSSSGSTGSRSSISSSRESLSISESGGRSHGISLRSSGGFSSSHGGRSR